MLLDALRRIWKSTHGDQTDEVRRQEIKEAIPTLGLSPNTKRPLNAKALAQSQAIKDAQDDFWHRCGNLMNAEPHLVANHFLSAFKQVTLSPQHLRVALGKVSPLPPHLDTSGLPYALQWCRRRGEAREEVSRVTPIEFV